jgi:hypothetical protein
MMSKIPRWWYAGFDKGFFHGCRVFIRSWFWTYANPLWNIRDKINKWRCRQRNGR